MNGNQEVNLQHNVYDEFVEPKGTKYNKIT